MILVIGGIDNGKKDFVLSLGYHESEFGTSADDKVIYKLNDIIKECLQRNIDVNEYVLNHIDNAHIIICDEVGNGIVPMIRADRQYREAVGRACCVIAKKADIVYRVYFGIGTKIKGGSLCL